MLERNTWSKVYRTSSNIGKKQNVNYEQTLKLFINASLIWMEGASKTLEDFTVQFIFFLFLDRGGGRIWLPPKKICLLATISPMKNHRFICPTQIFVVSSFWSIGIKTWGPLRQETDCSVNNNDFLVCLKVQHP